MKQTRWNILKDIVKRMWKYDRKIIYMMVVEVILSVAEPFVAILLPTIVIQLIVLHTEWNTFLMRILLLFGGYGLLQFLNVYIGTRNEYQYVVPRLHIFTLDWMNKTQDLSYSYFETQEAQEQYEQSGSAMFRGGRVGLEGVLHSIPKITSCGISLILYALFIGRIGWQVLLYLIGLSVCGYVIYEKCFALYLKKEAEVSENLSISRYFDSIAHKVERGKDIRFYQLQDILKKKMDQNNKDAIRKTLSALKYKQIIAQSNIIFALIRDGITYGFLIYLMKYKQLDITVFIFYLGVVLSYGKQFTTLTTEFSNLNANLDISKRWYVFKTNPNIINLSGKQLEDSWEIVFDDVSFQYPNGDDKVLEHFNLHFHAGEKLALVGINGAGKTTLVKLLCGLYEPTEGRILVNGIDLKEIDKTMYFSKLGVVFQEADLFSLTIGENVSSLEEGAYCEERVEKALKIAHLDDFVNTLAKGMHSYINTDFSEDGIRLSGGQKQRILIAKAYYKNPELMILDEPTAAMDALAERDIYNEYNQIIQGKSALFISHRLASTRFCDRILFLENGKVIEEGNHESLMQKNGKYAEMFYVQAQYYAKENEDETKTLLCSHTDNY